MAAVGLSTGTVPTEATVKQIFDEAASKANTFARTVLDEDFMPQTAEQYRQYTMAGSRARPAIVHIPEEHAYIFLGGAKLVEKLSQYSTALFQAPYAPKEPELR